MGPRQQRVLVERAGRRGAQPKGMVASTYDALTSPENASVVRSIAIFGVCIPRTQGSRWKDGWRWLGCWREEGHEREGEGR